MSETGIDAKLTQAELKELLRLQTHLDKLAAPTMLSLTKPTLTPDQYELLQLTVRNDEIANIAANQSGKTSAAALYVGWALLGEYPDAVDVCVGTFEVGTQMAWASNERYRLDVVLEQLGAEQRPVIRVFERRPFQCRMWPHAVQVWWSCWSGDKVRDSGQKLLFGAGRIEDVIGTGLLPKSAIVDFEKAPIVRNLLDWVDVRCAYGGRSRLQFKTNAKGSQSYTSEQVHLIVLDELHDEAVVAECRPRTTNTNGVILHTMTEAPGAQSKALDAFDGSRPRTVLVRSALSGMTFYSKAKQERIADKYTGAEGRARIEGLRSLGQGVVFTTERKRWVRPAPELADHWFYGKGVDFGAGGETGHPTAAVWCCVDRDTGTFGVYDEYLSDSQNVMNHIQRVSKPAGIPVFWPHDGDRSESRTMTAGPTVAQTWQALGEDLGLAMFPFQACYSDSVLGPQSSVAFLTQLAQLMEAGRFWVASHLTGLIKQIENLHYKDGKLHAVNDDLVMALKYAMIMERHWIQKTDLASGGAAMLRYM